MKKGFTLLEMLIVIVILAVLMGIIFRLSSIGTDSSRRATTIYRLQCLENCLSGYYAAFGSYPPVQRHGSPSPYLRVDGHGIQSDETNESIYNDNADSWDQIEAACRSQPVACNFPFPEGYKDHIRAVSESLKERLESGDEEMEGLSEKRKQSLMAGFDEASSNTGRFSGSKDKPDWRDIQLFRFGLMSYLLPRYLVMMNGADAYMDFAQWSDNNTKPSDPFSGTPFNSWSDMKTDLENGDAKKRAAIANIPSQAVCARWMPNLAGMCRANRKHTLFGIEISPAVTWVHAGNPYIHLYSPGGSESYQDQYVLDTVTVVDGWDVEFFYYSPSPHQKYTLWSSGPNKRTFPPWISRASLGDSENKCVAEWTHDDIIHMSN